MSYLYSCFCVFIIISGVHTLRANSISIDEVNVNCKSSFLCPVYEKKWKTLKKYYEEESLIKESIKLLLLEGGVKKLSYKLIEKDDKDILNVDIELYPKVNEIRFIHNLDIDLNAVKVSLPQKEEHDFFTSNLEICKSRIERFLWDRGLIDFTVTYKVLEGKEDVDIEFYIDKASVVIIQDIQLICNDSKIRRLAFDHFALLKNKPFNLINVRIEIDAFRNYLISEGFFFAEVEFLKTEKEDSTHEIIVVTIDSGSKYSFTFRGNDIFSNQELRQALSDLLRKGHKNFGPNLLKKRLIEHYESKGVFNTKIGLNIIEKKLFNEIKNKQFDFTIKEGHKIKIDKINFFGNLSMGNKILFDLYYENGSDLIKRDYFDHEYLELFSKILRNFYLKKGFVFAEINGPFFTFSADRKKVVANYKISEKGQVFIDEIEITGVDKTGGELEKELKALMEVRVNGELDNFVLTEDLKKIILYLKNKGYYYCSITNEKSSQLVIYNGDYSKSKISINISLGPIIHLGDVIITGNAKTKNHIILREIYLSSGDVVTPFDLDNIRNRLSALGLFNKVTILLIRSETQEDTANLLVVVEEREFGIIELAPGYRNDLGLKLTGSIGHNNLMGMNRAASLKGELNRRLSYSTYDKERDSGNIIEYSTSVNYVEPYFFSFPVTFQNSVTYSRKRYYAFDADTLSDKAYLSKDFSKVFSTSLAYQLDSIDRMHALDGQDNGYLRIGSMTPAMTFDFRDDLVNTRKGIYWGLSCQFANPYFYSQKKDDFEINFYKLVSRHAAFLPYPGGTFAVSLFWGLQENLVSASTGRKKIIPPTNVFRLSGIDNVRGYTENEINMLVLDERGGLLDIDISKAEVRNKAHYINIKVESRFFLGDDLVLAPFLDAGRVYLDHVNPWRLRSAAGLAFKYVTPMGALELSYGFKLNRLRYNQDGRWESPGNLALSIGVF